MRRRRPCVAGRNEKKPSKRYHCRWVSSRLSAWGRVMTVTHTMLSTIDVLDSSRAFFSVPTSHSSYFRVPHVCRYTRRGGMTVPLHVTPGSWKLFYVPARCYQRSINSCARQPTEVYRRVQLLSCYSHGHVMNPICSQHQTLSPSRRYHHHHRAGPAVFFVQSQTFLNAPEHLSQVSRYDTALRSVCPEYGPSTIHKRCACLPPPGVGLLKRLTDRTEKGRTEREIYNGGVGVTALSTSDHQSIMAYRCADVTTSRAQTPRTRDRSRRNDRTSCSSSGCTSSSTSRRKCLPSEKW